MNLAQITAAVGLNFQAMLFDGAALTIYSGTMPATPETALSGNTALVAWTCASPAAGAPSYSGGKMQATLSFTSNSASPSANGTAGFARVTTASAAAWVASHAYAVGALATNSSNLYVCIGAGTSAASSGPTGTSSSITDGTATWSYVGASTANVVCDLTVGTSGADVNLGSTTIATGTNVTMTSATVNVAAV